MKNVDISGNRLYTFEGCMSRKEYWVITLAVVLIQILSLVALILVVGNEESQLFVYTTFKEVYILFFVLLWIWLITINITTSVKRFHDTDLSGYHYLFTLIPYVGGTIVFVMNGFMAGRSNKYCPSSEKDNAEKDDGILDLNMKEDLESQESIKERI